MRSSVHGRWRAVMGGATALAAEALLCGALAVPANAVGRARFSAPVDVAVGRWPLRIVAADFNGDGLPDVATADSRLGSGWVSVALGRGNGSFRPRAVSYRTAPETADLAAADVNADGRPDLVAASGDGYGSVTVLLNDGAGRFTRDGIYYTDARAPAVAVADVSGDSRPDILTANLGRRDLGVLLALGAGRFAAPARVGGGYGATDIDVGDLNGDGNVDVVLATALWGNVVTVRLGHGDGSFAPALIYTAGKDPDGLTLADLNRDGVLDLAVTNANENTISVFLGRGDGSLTAQPKYRVSGTPEAVAAADCNADGMLDLATSAVAGPPAVASGRGDGTFAAGEGLDGRRVQGVATADFNRDGRPDLAFADADGRSKAWVYLNWTGLPTAPCVVGDLRGQRLRAATRSLQRRTCRLGHVRHRYSRRVRKNRVIAQRPSPGSVLPSHSRVHVTVSRGRR
jgi:FG-GAP-like repeat/PASTA domain